MATDVLRVSVACSTRRVDLALPAAVPLAELLPELVRSVGIVEPGSTGGYRLAQVGAGALRASAGLAEQGVHDGALLFLTRDIVPPPRRYDDVAEALADAVRHHIRAWSVEVGRRAALGTATVLLAIGAIAAVAAGPGRGATETVAAVAMLLGCVAVAAARRSTPGCAAPALACLACGYAGVAGLLLAPAGPLLGPPLSVAGAATALTGGLLAVRLAEHRTWLIPVVALGTLAGGAGLAAARDGPLAARAVLVVLVAAALAGVAAPAVAITVVRSDVDPDRAELVADDARTAQRILVGLQSTAGAVVVVATTLAVVLGVAGAAVACDAAVLVALHARRHRSLLHRGIGVAAAVSATIAGLVTALIVHPPWRPTVAPLAMAVGLGVLLASLLPATARRARTAELAEAAATIALVPLLTVALGLLSSVRSLGAPPW